MNIKPLHAAILAALVAGSAMPAAQAVDVNWIGADGAWEDGATNWSGGSAPGALDFATILHTGAVSSTAVGNTALELLSFSALSVSAGSLDVTGTLDTHGAVVVSGGAAMDLGRLYVQATGGFTLTGADTALDVVEGIFSSGPFTVTAGATATAESIDNFALMEISGGAVVSANSMINHADALLTASGAGTSFTINGAITNDGELEVGDGAELAAESIDNYGAARAGAGGALTLRSVVNEGTLEASGAAAVLTIDTILTNRSTFDVDDGASAALSDVVNHGSVRFSAASVTGHIIDNRSGATVALADGADVDLIETSLNRGTVTIDATSRLATGAWQQLAGTTTLDGGTLAASLPFGVDITGGSLLGHGVIDGNLVTRIDGTLSAGTEDDPVGMFDVTGDALLSGLLEVDIAGLGDFDYLDVAGTVTLGGTLLVELIDGFTPVAGDAFDIFTASSVTGSFASLIMPLLGGGLSFQTLIGANYVRLAVVAAPIPLPGAVWLLASALVASGALTRRRR